MGIRAAVVSADWVALISLWEAPTTLFIFGLNSKAMLIEHRIL
jgi:hypothetical protein